jgi:UDP-glucuronate 4-epimerase
MKQNILVTGAAGFIASNLVEKLLLDENNFIVGIDNFDPFYPRPLKEIKLNQNLKSDRFYFIEGDILDSLIYKRIPCNIDIIIHLAAKAGVRPSILNPYEYQKANIEGTLSVLEYAKINNIKKFIFASSSSVYGVNENVPWKEDEKLMPISPYAHTKLSCEMMGHVYSSIYSIQFIALRFFTVYGPGQRPDLAIHKFFRSILNGEPISLYGDGNTYRDYTYIDDVVYGIISSMSYNLSKFEIFNIGNNNTISLIDLVRNIEKITKKAAIINFLPEQIGDVPRTFADLLKSNKLLHYSPKTTIDIGLQNFYSWFTDNKLK